MGPEHGAVTRASVRPLTPNPPPPAKAPQPKGAGRGAARLRKGSCRRAPARESRSILLGAAPRDLSPGALGPRAVLLGGEAGHTEWRQGDGVWRCCCASRGAMAAGQSPAPPGFSAHGARVQKGTRPTRTCTPDGAKKRVAKGGGCRGGPAVGSAGARELGGRPARREQGALSPTNSL